MEFGGIALFVAIVLGGVFALPRIIDRRKAISSSREGDRFSADMSLVEQPDANEALHADSLNSQNLKLLPNATPKSGTLLTAAGGTMSNSAPKSVHADKYPAGYRDENQVENKAADKAEVQVEAKVEAGAERANSSGATRQETARKAKSKRSARLTGSSSRSDAGGAGNSKVGANSSARDKSAGARVEPSRSKISREISQLRSQRAGRLARESAAGQRRLVTAGISLALVVVIGVIAAATALSWWWIAVPAVFLAATLGFSVRAGKESMRQSEAEEERFAELKAKLLGNSASQAGSSSSVEGVAESAATEYASKRKAARQSMNKSVRKSSSRRASERADKRTSVRASERIGRKAIGKVNRPDAALETEEVSVAAVKTENTSAASRISGAPEISDVDAAPASVLAAATDDAAAADVSATSIANASTSSVENLPAVSAASSATSSATAVSATDVASTSKTSAKTSSAPRKASADSRVAEARRERSWSVGKLPQPSYAMKERVRGRTVHIDTDINPLVKLDGAVAQVPGRPVAVGQGSLREPEAVSELAASATAADFAAEGAEKRGYAHPSSSAKFDLEAILEQRRAQ